MPIYMSYGIISLKILGNALPLAITKFPYYTYLYHAVEPPPNGDAGSQLTGSPYFCTLNYMFYMAYIVILIILVCNYIIECAVVQLCR